MVNKTIDLGAKVRLIPVVVYGEQFEVRATFKTVDEMDKRLRETGKKAAEVFETVKDDTDIAKLTDAANEQVQDLFDQVLGSGAGKKIYAAAKAYDPETADAIVQIQTLLNVIEYIGEQTAKFKQESDKQKMQAVIDAKKKR